MLKNENFYGVKTGITNNAGSCLCSAFKINNKDYIAVVLGSPTQECRFKDTFNLY
jgi:D-alanyl-D-alanine carboxypeptidase